MSGVPVNSDSLLAHHPFRYEIYNKVDGEVHGYHPRAVFR
jgi:hypothetical protein